MRIGLFTLEIGRNVGGLEVYETELIRALAQVDRENEYAVFCLDPRVPEILGVDAPNFKFNVLRTGRVRGVLYDVPRAMLREKLDVFHAMFVPPPFTSIPYVFTHHGSEVIERPDFYPFFLGLRMRFLFKCAFRRARRIICVSDYVRDYLTSRQRIPASRLQTIYHGCRSHFKPAPVSHSREAVAAMFGVNAPYILCVGRIEPRKNPIRLLEAYAMFRQQISCAPKLVFVGLKWWSSSEFDRTVNRLRLNDHVVVLGHLADGALPFLYAGAEFAVYPSLWEGFGLPVLEAFASGTALISSRVTSIPEVAGDAAILVDPYSTTEIAGAMQSLYEDARLRERLIAAGLSRVRQFSWEHTAQQTVGAYAKAASDDPSCASFDSRKASSSID